MDPHVQVVVVVGEDLDDPARPAQPHPRAHEDALGPGRHEAVHQVLGQRPVDQRRLVGGALTPVEPRVVDVRVQPVLVGGVPQPAEAPAEGAAVRDG